MSPSSADIFARSADSPLQSLSWPWLPDFHSIYVKRDDLLHPIVSGNKWRKLRYLGDDKTVSVVSMGGPYSNHLHALAWYAKQRGWRATALVRGALQQTPTLQDCARWGMRVQCVEREAFRRLRDECDAWREWVDEPALWIPEGGRCAAAVRGVADLVAELPWTPDVVVCAAGTGTTAAGLARALPPRCTVIAVAALKNAAFLARDIAALLADTPAPARVQLITDAHLGGYAKTSPALQAFIEHCETFLSLPLEPVYTAKVFYALAELARRGLIQSSQRIVVIHTGGLQGRARAAGSFG